MPLPPGGALPPRSAPDLRFATRCICAMLKHRPLCPPSRCSMLAGKTGVGQIDRFDASEYPTTFAAQIRNFDNEG